MREIQTLPYRFFAKHPSWELRWWVIRRWLRLWAHIELRDKNSGVGVQAYVKKSRNKNKFLADLENTAFDLALKLESTQPAPLPPHAGQQLATAQRTHP